jgi:hypothetical protein
MPSINNEESLKHALKAEALSRAIGYTRGQVKNLMLKS